MEIWLMRHPPVGVPKGLCYGRTDVPLVSDWQERVNGRIADLPDLESLKLYTSPSSRCLKVAQYLKADRVVDERLMELDFGNWEGQMWQDLPREQLDLWSQDLHNAIPHGGESGAALIERCQNFWDELVQTGESSLIISHSGWIHGTLVHLLDISLTQSYRMDIDYLGLSKVLISGRFTRISFVNR